MKKRFGKDNPLIPKDVAQLIFSYLPPEERMEYAVVSTTWRDDLYTDPSWSRAWKRAGAASYQDFAQRFSQIKNIIEYDLFDYETDYNCETLKRRVLSGEYTLDLAENIYSIWKQPSYNRTMFLPQELQLVFYTNVFPALNKEYLCEDAGIMAMLDGSIDPLEAMNINPEILKFFIDGGLAKEALKQNLITLTEANQYPLNNLERILSREKCLDAVEAGWFNIEEAVGVDEEVLELLLPDGGYDSELWIALSRGDITLKMVERIGVDKLEIMMCERGLRFVEKGVIDWYQVYRMNVENLEYLVSWEGEEAISEYLVSWDGEVAILEIRITIEDLLHFPARILELLTTERGARVLKNHIIHRSVACEIGVDNLSALVSKRGEQALIEKRFSVEDVLNLPPGYLRYMLNDWGFEMMNPESQLITFRQCRKLTKDQMITLFSEAGSIALKEGLVNVDLIPSIPWKKLEVLLSEQGREMLKAGYITFDNSMSLGKLRILSSEWGIEFLEEGIINQQIASDMDEENLRALVSEAGKQGLIDKRFSVDDVLDLSPDCLRFFIGTWGPVMMDPQKPLVTIEDLKKLASAQIWSLFSEKCFNALSEGLVKIDQIQLCTSEKLEVILNSDKGLRILREGHVTFMDMASVNDIQTLEHLIGKYDQCKVLFSKGVIKFSDFASVSYAGWDLINQLDAITGAMNDLSIYKNRLIGLNPRLPSLNKNRLRHDKGEQLQKLFFEIQSSSNEDNNCAESSSVSTENNYSGNDLLESILSDPENDLIKNCSRLPFKFFKLKSRRHGYRNPYLENRLCESETEVRLVQIDAARAA